MDERLNKKSLIRIATQVRKGERVDAEIVAPFLEHEFPESSVFGKAMLRLAAWISLFFASVLVIFPEVGEYLIAVLPGILLLPERVATALDYVWGLVGEPVGEQHLMYHVPNIIVYAFGVAGIRSLWRRINKNNWKDLVESSQAKLKGMIAEGTGRFRFAPGFSLLFVGDGDRIGKSLVIDDPVIGATLSTRPPKYTGLWGKYVVSEGDDGFERVLEQFNSQDAGEYVFFPVVDQHLFLPGPNEYDIPPHRIEIAVQRIREFESESGWPEKRIVIVGDKEQKSRFVTSTGSERLETPDDDVSLKSVAAEYSNVIVLDPTEVTLRRIMDVADGRQILFRASDQGAVKYGKEFYHRLSLIGYAPTKEGILIVGYDISDLETEHQVLSHRQSEYLPVILSRDIFDLLSKKHLKDGSYIFVPHLVKDELRKLVADEHA